MDLKEFNQIKEKLIDTESKICEAFGIVSCMQCSKCNQKISFFQVLEFFDKNNIKNKITCPLCQSHSIGLILTTYDPADEYEILEYYIQSISFRIKELYESKISCGISPYEKDFLYSQLIANIFITLEYLISKIVVRKLTNKKRLDDTITQYITEKMRPDIRDYIELLEICGLEDAKNNFAKLRSIWNIRNDIVHRGYKADFFDFSKIYAVIGEILVYLEG